MRVLLFILFPIPSLEPFHSVLLFSLSCFTLSSLSLSLSHSLFVFYVGLNLSNYNHKETVYFCFYLHHLHAFYRAMEIGKTYQIIIIPFFKRFALQIITCMPWREYKCSICLHICPSNIFIISYYIVSWRQLFFSLLYPFEGIFYPNDVENIFI